MKQYSFILLFLFLSFMVSKSSNQEDFNFDFDFDNADSLNIYIHGVDNFNPITTIRKYIPESEIQPITINDNLVFFRIDTFHSISGAEILIPIIGK